MKATHAGSDWSFSAALTEPGLYGLWAQAVDAAGNATTVDPFTVQVGVGPQFYLPAIFNNAALIPESTSVNLRVEEAD